MYPAQPRIRQVQKLCGHFARVSEHSSIKVYGICNVRMELKLTVCIVASFADEVLYIPVIERTEPQAKASFAGLLCTLDLFSASTPDRSPWKS